MLGAKAAAHGPVHLQAQAADWMPDLKISAVNALSETASVMMAPQNGSIGTFIPIDLKMIGRP